MPALSQVLTAAALAVGSAQFSGFADGKGRAPSRKRTKFQGAPGGKGRGMDGVAHWDPSSIHNPSLTMATSEVCKVMAPLWLTARRLLGDTSAVGFSDQECSFLHEYYKGPHVPPRLRDFGYKVPTDCLGYVGIYKSASSETLCNLRNNLGRRPRWAQGMANNILQRMIQIHMFPVLNESADAVVDPDSKYYEDNPQDLARSQREGRPRHGTAFTWVREPALRFVSGYSEIEYYFTIGEPYFFYDFVLHSPQQRERYRPGHIVGQAKRACVGCSFWDDAVNSSARAKQFVLDFLKVGMRPEFLWRHIFPQVAQANVFFDAAGPLDFVCHLESFERGWEFAGMMINRQLSPFNRSCRDTGYSGSGSGFEPRETMNNAIFGTEDVSSETCAADGKGSEACRTGGSGGASDVAKSLGCALLLPDYVCFGYKNIVEPADCVAAGFADSVQQWEEIQLAVRREICPGVRRWIGGLYDSGPLDASTVQEVFREKLADGM
ncbi:unnamed protein product [Prorocentrum cordatum]|uniref:Uncharacterized protein n=1 Tax=Prorocentrum cordatum TaxID=2364126 RepID=A0ABN9WR61_9DINO|nr:unnamed protein product [Polarella glacialis]